MEGKRVPKELLALNKRKDEHPEDFPGRPLRMKLLAELPDNDHDQECE